MSQHPGHSLFEAFEGVGALWSRIFGATFSKTWDDSSHALRQIVEEGRTLLNKASGRNQAHLTLLLREPLLDRLEIEASTEHSLSRRSGRPGTEHVPRIDENYDEDRGVVFYPLCDRLLLRNARSRSDDVARQMRGLTGWVGVTGCYLKVNHEGAEQLLEHIDRERPDTSAKVGIYGRPKWSRRSDEFPPDPTGSHSKRFLAVPISASSGGDRPLGVMRYTCPLHEPELTSTDMLALEGLARLVAAVLNISLVKATAYRDDRLSLEAAHLRETSNLRHFLSFLGHALGVRIASIYVALERPRRLRLFDAVGLSDDIGDCRESVRDYEWDGDGLTAELWRRSGEPPIRLHSVRQRDSWRGLNTEVFYKKTLKEWGISWQGTGDVRDVLKDYPIPLLGAGLLYKGDPVGVVKAEFPTTGQSLREFDEADVAFLNRACQSLAEELANFRKLLAGDWSDDPEACVRRYLEIERTALVKQSEAEEFWKASDNYMVDSGAEIRRATRIVVTRMSPPERSRLLARLSGMASGVGGGVVSGLGRELAKLIFDVVRQL